MKFRDWVAEVQQLLIENPDCGEYEVYMSQDPEGNGFIRPANFSFCEGMVDNLNYRLDYFYHEQDIESYQQDDPDFVYKPNIIVIWP